MEPISGGNRGGTMMARFAEYETLLKNSESFATRVAQNAQATSSSNPLLVDIPNFIHRGNIRSNSVNINNMSRAQLIEFIRQTKPEVEPQ